MRINDLLILESEMLLESYKDFRRIWNEMLSNARPSVTSGRNMTDVPEKLEMLLKDNRVRSIISNDTNIRPVLLRSLHIQNPLDASSWVAGLRSCVKQIGEEDALTRYYNGMKVVEREVAKTIKNRTPEYTTIEKTSSYIIFDVENFAAAKKLRNQVKATWCIGSDDSYFDQYGKNKNRDTIIVFFMREKEGMVFHVDSSGGGLITSHDNQREWEVRGGAITNSRGYNHIASELGVYLKSDELARFMKAVGMRVKDSELVVPEEIVREAGKLLPYVLDDFSSSLRDGQYPRVYKETSVRREVSSHIAQKTTPVFRRGNVFHILDDAKKLFGALLIRDIPDNAEGVEVAADTVMCAKMIVRYLNNIQNIVVHGEIDGLILGAEYFLNSVLDLGGRLKTTREYKDALERSWPRVVKVINAVKEAI